MSEESLPQAIADQLRRDILRGVLEPGAAVKEREQASQRDVSRTPMREAIRILAKEGLIQLRHSRSPIVADPSFSEINDQIEVLKALESLAGELACERASEAEVARIRNVNDELAAAYGSRDPVDVFELDMAFHIAMTAASRNQNLIETHRSYLERLWRARYLASAQAHSRERVLRQHGAMISGLEQRDPSRVRREINAHLRSLVVNIRHLYGVQGGGRSSMRDSEKDSEDEADR